MSCSLECKLQVRAFVLFISVSAAPKTMPTTGVVLNKSLSNERMHKSYNFTIEKYFSANICHYDFTSHFPAVILLTKQFTIIRESIKKASCWFKLLECTELSCATECLEPECQSHLAATYLLLLDHREGCIQMIS